LKPSVALITLKPSAMLLYMVGLAYSRNSYDITCSCYLFATLDNIEGADGGMGKTAGEDTTNHALGVV
jgi:hypothetical protein